MKIKIIIITAIVLILSSCVATKKYIAEEEGFYSIDFIKHSENGFYISPEHPEGKYIPVGLIDYHFIPRAVYSDVPSSSKINSFLPVDVEIIQMWIQDPIILENCIDTLVNHCTGMGANAIYNFELESYDKDFNEVANPTTIRGIRITGFAVKLED